MALTEIRSPLPGTFYRRPAPDKPPFREAGDSVGPDDVVGLVEVMKTFIEVKAEVAGRIVRFVAESEQPIGPGDVIAEVEV